MSSEAIIQKYSQALAEIATQGKVGVFAFEIETVSKIFSSTEAQSFFNSPHNSLDSKLTVAKSSLEGKCMPEVFNYFIKLVENGRIYLVSKINEQFQKMIKSQAGEVHGVLYSAAEQNEQFKVAVEERLTKKFSKKVILSTEIDKNLIAGFKVKVAGWTIDDSALFHINKLKEEISAKA